MNIIVVENGKITHVFSRKPQHFIVLEGGAYRDQTIRDLWAAPLEEAEKLPEITCKGNEIARTNDLYIASASNGYYVGKDGGQECCMGDGVNTYTLKDKAVSPGTLLFQALSQEFLKDPEVRTAYWLDEPV